MSRMHSSKRGRSGSTRPYVTSNPDWVKMDSEEIEEKILQLFKRGKSPSDIGVVLRDQYAVPNVKLATGKDISEILKENDVYQDFPEDLVNLMEKAVNLSEHLEDNRKDLKNKRGLQLIESKIRRLAKYYQRKGDIPGDWRYSLEVAEMLTQ
ncbi:MAG: 30S ribosomal protein S15 [Candidatus Saliniplasma sp.]